MLRKFRCWKASLTSKEIGSRVVMHFLFIELSIYLPTSLSIYLSIQILYLFIYQTRKMIVMLLCISWFTELSVYLSIYTTLMFIYLLTCFISYTLISFLSHELQILVVRVPSFSYYWKFSLVVYDLSSFNWFPYWNSVFLFLLVVLLFSLGIVIFSLIASFFFIIMFFVF